MQTNFLSVFLSRCFPSYRLIYFLSFFFSSFALLISFSSHLDLAITIYLYRIRNLKYAPQILLYIFQSNLFSSINCIVFFLEYVPSPWDFAQLSHYFFGFTLSVLPDSSSLEHSDYPRVMLSQTEHDKKNKINRKIKKIPQQLCQRKTGENKQRLKMKMNLSRCRCS